MSLYQTLGTGHDSMTLLKMLPLPFTETMATPINEIVPQLHSVEYVVIAVYMIFLACVGPLMKNFNRNSDDYFRGGARTTWWLMGPSLALSMVSATVFTGVAGAIYEAGAPPLASNAAQWVAGAILVWFLAAWFRRLRFVTAAEVVRQRFGPTTEQFYSYLNMLLQPMYGSFQLLGLAIFVSAVFKIPLTSVVLGLGFVVGFYSVSGGRWAVMATDFLQTLILLPVIIAVTVLGLQEVGGLGNLIDALGGMEDIHWVAPEGAYPDGRYTLAWIVAVFSMQFIGQLNLSFNSRFFTAKDGREARKAALFMTLLMLFGTAFFTVPALVSKILYADQVAAYAGVLNKASESAYVVACLNLLPNGLLGMVLVAMFSATASSMDTGLNANSAVIVRNIFPPLRRFRGLAPLDGHSEMVWGKRVSIVLAIFIIGLTLWMAEFGRSGIFELVLGFASAVNFPMTLPFFLVLIFRKAPRLSAIFSISAGLLGPRLVEPLFEWVGFVTDFPTRVAIVAGCSLTGFALSYLWPRKDSEAEVAATRDFYSNMRRRVDFKLEVGEGNDREQLRMIGILTLTIAFGILLLLFIPNDLQARKVISLMGLGVGLVGALLLYCSRLGKGSGAA